MTTALVVAIALEMALLVILLVSRTHLKATAASTRARFEKAEQAINALDKRLKDVEKQATALTSSRASLDERVTLLDRTRGNMNLTDFGVRFAPFGYMGDGEGGQEFLRLKIWSGTSHSAPDCVQVKYYPGSYGWAGSYWQNRLNNWGDRPGDDLREPGFRKISVWARGERGGERVEFKAGGIRKRYNQYRDSFEVTAGRIELTKEWREYVISLDGTDLSSVIGAFAFIAQKGADAEPVTFYVDDIEYQR